MPSTNSMSSAGPACPLNRLSRNVDTWRMESKKSRASAEATRALMIETALGQVAARGISFDAATLTLEHVIRLSGAPRSTVFRIWPNRHAFVADVVKELFASDSLGPDGFDEGALGNISALIAYRQEEMATRQGREIVLASVAQGVVEANMAAVRASHAWTTYRTLRLAKASSADSFGGENLDAIFQSVEQKYILRTRVIYREINSLFSRRMRAGLTEDDLSAALTSLVEGMTDRASVTDRVDGSDQTQVGDHAVSPTARAVHAVYVAFTEDTSP